MLVDRFDKDPVPELAAGPLARASVRACDLVPGPPAHRPKDQILPNTEYVQNIHYYRILTEYTVFTMCRIYNIYSIYSVYSVLGVHQIYNKHNVCVYMYTLYTVYTVYTVYTIYTM